MMGMGMCMGRESCVDEISVIIPICLVLLFTFEQLVYTKLQEHTKLTKHIWTRSTFGPSLPSPSLLVHAAFSVIFEDDTFRQVLSIRATISRKLLSL